VPLRLALRLLRRDLALRHGDPGEGRELADGFDKVGARRPRPAVDEVEEADEVSALYDETPRPVDVAIDAFRSRRAGKGARGVRRRLQPIAFAAEAEFREGAV
jgi:hypothetical protein